LPSPFPFPSLIESPQDPNLVEDGAPLQMEFIDLVQKRYSVRAYKPQPVEDAKLAKVLEAVRLAPTAANRQPFQLIVAHVKGREAELQRVYPRRWFIQAPLVICVCGVPAQGWVRDVDHANYTRVDVAVAMDHPGCGAPGFRAARRR
jgi:nitroreductase